MNISNGPVRPIPADIDPPNTICLQIEVPDDRQWIAALYDAIYQLTYWFAWDRDDAHTGAIIAKRWLKAMDTIRLCREVQAPSGCPDPGDDYLIRQNPDNPCLIESSADGTHWCTLIDISLCTPATGQPGGGADQPQPGGGDACYKGVLNAAQSWLLPTVVNAGDVLTFSNYQGAGTDGSGHWYCPDGQIFFAGACVGSLSFNGGDPAPAIHHMAIIAKIGAVYYDITAGPITVPGGISNAPVTVQVNDTPLTDNAGDYKFDVCVQNNQATTFTHTFDFALSNGGFIAEPYSDGPTGLWTAGQGWKTQVDTSASHWADCFISRTFPSRTLTAMRFQYSASWATNGNPGTYSAKNGAGTVLATKAPDTGSHVIWVPAWTPAAFTKFMLDFTLGKTVAGLLSGYDFTLEKVTVSGIGSDPF